ncbi:MAG: choice-of-anchor B family protein [Bacteroidota bacterium]
MRNLYLLFSMLLATASFGQQTNYNITFISKFEYPGQRLANIWGYAANGKEYALVGAADGMSIVDVTDPANPVELEQLTDGITSNWREIKTYGTHAYITSEGVDINNQGGLGIADLSNLPNPVGFHKYHGDGPINGSLRRVHALDVDEATGHVYLYGPDAINPKGIICLNLLPDPYNPTYAGQYSGSYVHDGYSNNNIVFGSHIYGGYFSIIDFTNKSNPQVLATQSTPTNFTHNTWISTDGTHLFTTDETSHSYLTAYNIEDVNDIYETDRIRTTPGSGSIVHNTYTLNDHVITSWYKDGVTITDVSRPQNIIQVGAYDTYTAGSGSGFAGAWGVYPYLPSGNLLVTNMVESVSSGGTGGVLYILAPTYPDACYLEGKITDANTGTGIFGATVKIDHTDPLNETFTDLVGNYGTGQPTAGTFNVTVSEDSHVPKTLAVTLSPGAVTTLNVELVPQSLLAVEWERFTAVPKQDHNLLAWATSSEKNTDRFEIQRRMDEQSNWQPIGSVSASGNSATLQTYQFKDEMPTWRADYRIRLIDQDGTFQFSKIVSVARPVDRFDIKNTYPIPSAGLVQLVVLSEKERLAALSVVDLAGKIVHQLPTSLQPGENKVNFELPTGLSSGLYYIQLISGNEMRKSSVILRR